MGIFQKARKTSLRLRLLLVGPSGSGKTMSALRIARGLVGPEGRIAVIDTENGSSSMYSDHFDFDQATMNPPYLVAKYLKAWEEAVAGEYDCLIVDSLTHAWAGEGGLLQKKEALDARGGNSFTNWAQITKEHEALKARILNTRTHLICTTRAKTEYVVETNDKGKSAPRKVGMAPVQREGMEYEFDVCLDLAMDHQAAASKDRTGLFDGQLFLCTEETGKTLLDWLGSGGVNRTTPPPTSPPAPEPAQPTTETPPAGLTDGQASRLMAIAVNARWTEKEVLDRIGAEYGVTSLKELTKKQYEDMIHHVVEHPGKAAPGQNTGYATQTRALPKKGEGPPHQTKGDAP